MDGIKFQKEAKSRQEQTLNSCRIKDLNHLLLLSGNSDSIEKQD